MKAAIILLILTVTAVESVKDWFASPTEASNPVTRAAADDLYYEVMSVRLLEAQSRPGSNWHINVRVEVASNDPRNTNDIAPIYCRVRLFMRDGRSEIAVSRAIAHPTARPPKTSLVSADWVNEVLVLDEVVRDSGLPDRWTVEVCAFVRDPRTERGKDRLYDLTNGFI